LLSAQHLQSSFWRIWALIKFELIRLFFTKRGMLAVLAFATAWFIILYYPVNSAVSIVSSENFKDMAKQMFGVLGLSELLNWPVSELSLYWLIAIYSFPIFAVIASSDQTCADRTRGTLRFISLRASRNEILFGRFLGQVMIISALILVTLLATMIMAIWRDASLFVPALTKSLYLFKELFIAVLPFIALMAFFNSFLKSAKLTAVITMLFFGLGSIFIAILEYQIPAATHLNYVLPGVQLDDVVGQQGLGLSHYIIPLVQTSAYLALASIFMKRSAL